MVLQKNPVVTRLHNFVIALRNAPVVEAGLMDLVEANHRITDEVWLEPTPGHTPGHVSVHISSRGQEAIITGDMMHHPIQLADLDKPANFDMDKPQGVRTRREFVEKYQGRKVMIIGSHFCDPTSGWIVPDGPDGKGYKLVTQ